MQAKKLGFVEAMKLAERDRALLSIGIDPATINPSPLLEESYIASLCWAANALALVGHTYLEDEVVVLLSSVVLLLMILISISGILIKSVRVVVGDRVRFMLNL